jgi:hypothetical protein
MATYTSTATGLWSAGATWVGGVKPPSAGGHKVVIAATHVVTFDEAAGTYGDDTSTGITVNGTLKASRAASTQLTCRGDLYIGVAGTLDYGTEADPITSAYTATIIINDSAAPVSNKWGIRTEETSGDWAGFRMWGASKTAVTTVPLAALSTDTTFTVADATGWAIGDWVVFEPSVAQNVANGSVWRAITGVSGNAITVGANLGYASQAGRRVANLSRNVRVWGTVGNTYRTHIALRFRTAWASTNNVEIGPCEIRAYGGSGNTHQAAGIVMSHNSINGPSGFVKKIDGPVVHDVWSISGSTVTSLASGGAGIGVYAIQNYNYTISNALVSSSRHGTATIAYSGASVTYENLTVIGAARLCQTGFSQGCVGLVFNGGVSSGITTTVFTQNGVDCKINGMTFDWLARFNDASDEPFGTLTYTSCVFGSGNNVGILNPTTSVQWRSGAYSNVLVNGCTIKEWPLSVLRTLALNAAQTATNFKIRNANNDQANNLVWYKWGEQYRDGTTINRGASSVRLDCWFSGFASTVSRTIEVAASQTITVVGYLRFNPTYGTATPPSATISGLGATPQTFTAPATEDAWHKFTLTITNPQSYAGEFTLTASGSSTAASTGAYYWLDGILITDFVGSVRHYGYVFDALAYRTTDPKISEATEATVSGYTSLGTLDKVYDRLALWSCENQGSAVPHSYAGSELLLGAYDLVVDATAVDVLDITGGTITIKATTLLAGTAFTKVSTTGEISFVNGASAGSLLVYEDTNGVSVPLTVSGVRNGTKVRVVRTDTSAEISIGSAGASGYAARLTWTTDLPIRADSTYTSGVDCEQEASALGTLTANGAALTIVQTPCTIYEANGIDGSTVTGLTLDAPNIEIDADEADNAMTVQEIYAWFKNELMTDSGIRTLFGAITAENAHKYRINASVVPLKIDQKDVVNSLVLSGGMLYRDDGVALRLAGSGVIEFVLDDVYESTAAEAALAAIKAKTDNLPSDPADQSLVDAAIAAIPAAPSAAATASAVRSELATELARIDAATSTRLASASYAAPANADIAAIKAKTDSLAFTVAGQVDANIQYVHDVAVKGVGSEADPWNPA